MLGGSSVLNYMLYVRGNRKDYDDWEAQVQCCTFTFLFALQYMQRSEDAYRQYSYSICIITIEAIRFASVLWICIVYNLGLNYRSLS